MVTARTKSPEKTPVWNKGQIPPVLVLIADALLASGFILSDLLEGWVGLTSLLAYFSLTFTQNSGWRRIVGIMGAFGGGMFAELFTRTALLWITTVAAFVGSVSRFLFFDQL